MICIYVAIGQKASTVAQAGKYTEEDTAPLDYTTVMSSTASDACTAAVHRAICRQPRLAEYFMHEGKDVLIVYDDLSKHAVAYRAIVAAAGAVSGTRGVSWRCLLSAFSGCWSAPAG